MLNSLAHHKLIAILRNVSADRAASEIDMLYNMGVRFVEIAFRSEWSPKENGEFLRCLDASQWPELTMGAGTVLSTEAVSAAKDAGAKFVLSPNCNTEVIKAAKDAGLFAIPGALTPTEVETAIESGADVTKVFPVGQFGPTYLKDLLAPLPHARLCAVGGVSLDNAASYLNAGALCVGIGSALQPLGRSSGVDRQDALRAALQAVVAK